VKGDGGAVDLTEDPASLRRWMVSGPEVSRIVDQFAIPSSNAEVTNDTKHYEVTHILGKDFLDQVNRLTSIISNFGNPFEEEPVDLFPLDS